MRLRLALYPKKQNFILPFNYQYYLASAIYKLLLKVSPAYGQFLHDKGYSASTGRLMKLFTFSKLFIPNSRVTKYGLTACDSGPWILYISSPMIQDFIKNFVKGLFEESKIELKVQNFVLLFRIGEIDFIPEPDFKFENYFRTLSPIVLSTTIIRNGEKTIYYYRPTDKELSLAIENNLKNKLSIVNPEMKIKENFSIQLDREYINRRLRRKKRLTKKITIKPDTPQATEIIGFEIPFKMTCNQELMRIAWQCGVGEHNSQGFGMIDILN